MAKMVAVDGKELSKQAQKIIKSVKQTTSPMDKANAALALSVLSLLSREMEPTISQQFLKFVKDIQK